MAKIADAFSIIRNGANIKQGLDDSGYPITRIETISNRTVDRNKMGYAGVTDISKYFDYVLQNGDILMSHINSETHLGKVALYEKQEDETIIHGMNLLCLRPKKELLDSRYAFYYLSSDAFLRQIPRITKKSVNQASFNVAALKELTIPIPEIEKQRDIVRGLDKVSELIALRKEQIVKLDQLVKSRFIELFGDYRINEKGFDCKKGSELFKFSSGKFLPEEKRLDEGIPVYGGNGIAWYTSESLVDYPTIIIGRVGAQCGNVHAVTTPVWITDNAIYIKEQKTNAYTLEFLTELMRMMDFYQYADFSGQPKITQKPLETLNYIMPPIELQNEYTAFVEQTDKSKLAIQQSLDKLELLKKSLMQEYFG